jgi:hypothetical protein
MSTADPQDRYYAGIKMIRYDLSRSSSSRSWPYR